MPPKKRERQPSNDSDSLSDRLPAIRTKRRPAGTSESPEILEVESGDAPSPHSGRRLDEEVTRKSHTPLSQVRLGSQEIAHVPHALCTSKRPGTCPRQIPFTRLGGEERSGEVKALPEAFSLFTRLGSGEMNRKLKESLTTVRSPLFTGLDGGGKKKNASLSSDLPRATTRHGSGKTVKKEGPSGEFSSSGLPLDFMPDPRTRDEVLADPVMKRFLNGAPLEAYGYCTMYEETDKYITAVIDPIISRPPAYEDVVHRDSPDEKAEGVAWVCVGPHAYGDVYISSQQTYCRVCGKSRNAVGLRSPTVSRRARDWDITAKNLPLIFFTDPKCRAIPIDKKKNTYSLHGTVSWWNATAVRRKLQVENTFPQLTSEELHGLWQRPGRFTDEENLKASLDKLLGASGVITASKMAKRKKKEPSAQTNDRPRKVKQASEEESIASSDDHKDDPKDDHEDEPEEDDSNLATDSDIDDDEDDSEDEEGGNDSGDDSGDDEILRFPNTGEAAMKKATM